MSLTELEERLSGAFSNRALAFSRAALLVNITLAAALAGSTIFQFFTTDVWKAANTAGVAVSVVGFFCSAVLLVINKDASTEIELARVAINEAHSAQEQYQSLEAYQIQYQKAEERARELYLATKSMVEIVEQLYVAPLVRGMTATKFLSAMLIAASRSLKISLGFEMNQHFTLCIYEARGSGANVNLHLIAHERSTPCEMSAARVWKSGTGVGGHAHQTGREVIISDSMDTSVASLVGHSPKPNDNIFHRSFVAVPIRTGTSGPVWGVVVATTSNPYHFSADGESGISAAEAARVLAAVSGLAVQALKNKREITRS